MNQLERTIVDNARQQLAMLQHALSRPISNDRNDDMSSAFWMASGFVMLANLADSGLSEAARDALMAIEKEISSAMAKSPGRERTSTVDLSTAPESTVNAILASVKTSIQLKECKPSATSGMLFVARVTVEGPFSSDATIYTPLSLLELALQHALFIKPAEEVKMLVEDTTKSMLHSLSCKRRSAGEVVRLIDDDPDGYNGLFRIADDRGAPTDCVRCGNHLCNEWPSLAELSPEGAQTGDYAYHVSECQMLDPN